MFALNAETASLSALGIYIKATDSVVEILSC